MTDEKQIVTNQTEIRVHGSIMALIGFVVGLWLGVLCGYLIWGRA